MSLRTARRISHVFVIDVPRYADPLIITGAAINIVPIFDDKRDICQNAIDLAQVLRDSLTRGDTHRGNSFDSGCGSALQDG
jgi:phosphotransacetylase